MENNGITEEKYQQIGRRIRDARDDLRMTQTKLASAVGFQSATAISLIEDGKRRVKPDDLEKIANALNEDVTYLLTGIHPASAVKVSTALRADKDLSPKDVQDVESFIQYIKSQRRDGRGQ